MDDEQYLEEFKTYLDEKGINEEEIETHLGNVDFYLNEYVGENQNKALEDATSSYILGDFFGYYLIYKTVGNPVDLIEEVIHSLRMFFDFMVQNEYASSDSLNEFNSVVENNKEEWLEEARKYCKN